MDPVSTGIMAAGSIVQGVGGLKAGNYNAKVDRANAQNALIAGAGQEQDARDKARQQMGEQIASQGASGFQLGTGSNFDALQQSATNREMDVMNIRRQAQGKANAYDQQAAIDKAKGQAALTSGLFGAAAAMSKGFSDAAYQKQLAGGGTSSMSWDGGGGWDATPDDTVNYSGSM